MDADRSSSSQIALVGLISRALGVLLDVLWGLSVVVLCSLAALRALRWMYAV